MGKCFICGSSEDVCRFKGGELYCPRHYGEMYRFGEIKNLNGKRKENIYKVSGNYIEFKTTRDNTGYIDAEDIHLLDMFYWGINSQGYLHTRQGANLVRLHHVIIGYPLDKVVDHINRNKLDNRRENLRICEQKENTKNISLKKNNTSGFRGVSLVRATGKWRSRINVDGSEINLGRYENIEDAIKARVEGERKHYGEFSPEVR